jgi:hypothetical protein
MTLEQAITLAVQVHAGQVDKGGEQYILHPLRVMQTVEIPAVVTPWLADYEGLTDTQVKTSLRIIGILHDVFEDHPTLTVDEAHRKHGGLTSVEQNALRVLTHERGVSYERYIEHIALFPFARLVKIADLKDNSDLTRLKVIEEKDIARVAKYHRALARLSQHKLGD